MTGLRNRTSAAAVVVVAAAGVAWFMTGSVVAKTSTSDNVSSRLMVHIPHSLYRDDGYDHREALFGTPPYGGSIAQNVFYADSTLCDGNVDQTTGYPERPKDPATNKMKPWPSPYILMVDRGGCTFVEKVRKAQHAGAAGVLIADHTCLCDDLDCLAATGLSSCESQEPIMADDGSGGDISVPSFLMFKHDADKIKEELKANRPVQVEMTWSLPHPDDRVEYDLWTVPEDVISLDFVTNFQPVAEALGDRAYFSPHMYLHDGIKSHCQGADGENYCYTLCTNKGRYCATDPDNDLDKGISGADVVKESLRRICIWEKYGAADGIGVQWWTYVREFHTRCAGADYFADETCIADAYKHSKIYGADIENCMSEAGGTEDNRRNSRLDTEISLQSQRGVVVVPSTFVNLSAIRGQLSVSNVFMAICAGYADGSKPAACDMCVGCSDVPGCLKAKYCKAVSNGSNNNMPSNQGVSTHTFATSILFVIGLFSALGVWHYKRTREDMRDQVRGILAEYMPLEDNEHGGGGMGMGGGMMSGMMSGSFMNGGGNNNNNHGGGGMMSNPMAAVGNPMDFARGGTATSLIS